MTMEEEHNHHAGLLERNGKAESTRSRPAGAVWEEAKKVSLTALPMVVVTVTQFLPQVVSTMMAGHLGELSLSAAAIASSFADVTGFSVLLGMAGALETLCGQTYGAEEYQKFGNYTSCAILSLILICVPVSLLWTYMDKILMFFGQDPLISQVAGKYSIHLIPALFGYAVLQSLVRYFQTQSLILPMLVSSCSVLCLHVPLCWLLTFKLELGNAGSALAIGISYWLNVACLVLYMSFSTACEKTRVRFSKDSFFRIKEFVRFAIPSAVMLCLEYASFELLVFLCGFLPNAKLEASVLSICLTTTTFIFYIPYGIGAAASTRVSNELGAGNSGAAKLATAVAAIIVIGEALIAIAVLFCSHKFLGYAYSNEKEVVDYVNDMVPLLCFNIFADSLAGLLSGVARGCGWQNIAAYVNLGAYYGVGIPMAILLGFVFKLRGKGLWIGVSIGTTLQALSLSLVTAFTNWEKQAEKARDRIYEENTTLKESTKIPLTCSNSAE